jgi:ADP-ribose pyrophosphatase YjhB (NUDIX family)
VTLDEDLLAEGEPEKEFHEGIAARFPRKRVGAGALIRNPAGHLLMVQPTYRAGWGIPGGVVEENESPLSACDREIREELGVSLPLGQLLVVDWTPRHGVWGDSLHFIFDGGTLEPDRLSTFTLQADEIAAVTFASIDVAAQHVQPSMARRLTAAIDAASEDRTLYLQFGRRDSSPDRPAASRE